MQREIENLQQSGQMTSEGQKTIKFGTRKTVKLSDLDIPVVQALEQGLFSPFHLKEDIRSSINRVEMAKRRFRDILRRFMTLLFGEFRQRFRRGSIVASAPSRRC